MIDFCAIQISLLKQLMAPYHGIYGYCEMDNEKIAVTDDGYRVLIIPKDKFFIRFPNPETEGLKKYFENAKKESTISAEPFGRSFDGKYIIFMTEDKKEIIVAAKLLDGFPKNVSYRVLKDLGEKSSVYLFDMCGEVIGGVLPTVKK